MSNAGKHEEATRVLHSLSFSLSTPLKTAADHPSSSPALFILQSFHCLISVHLLFTVHFIRLLSVLFCTTAKQTSEAMNRREPCVIRAFRFGCCLTFAIFYSFFSLDICSRRVLNTTHSSPLSLSIQTLLLYYIILQLQAASKKSLQSSIISPVRDRNKPRSTRSTLPVIPTTPSSSSAHNIALLLSSLSVACKYWRRPTTTGFHALYSKLSIRPLYPDSYKFSMSISAVRGPCTSRSMLDSLMITFHV